MLNYHDHLLIKLAYHIKGRRVAPLHSSTPGMRIISKGLGPKLNNYGRINTTPLRIHSTMLDYARFLLHRHISIYLSAGVKEVHIIFDQPATLLPSTMHPKDIEKSRRDASKTACDEHFTFTDSMKIPSKWGDMLGCRVCKQHLTSYLGDCLLRLAPAFLTGTQKLVISWFLWWRRSE